MTDYNIPSGYVLESGHYSGALEYYGWRVFQQVNTGVEHMWSVRNNNQPCYIGYEFDNRVEIKKIDISVPDDASERNYMPTAITIQGSNNGTNWTDLKSVTISDFTRDKVHSFDIENSDLYKYYRLYCTAFNRSDYCNIGMINMYEKILV